VNASTMMVWSMALGGIAAVVVARLADLASRPSAAQVRAVGYHLSVLLLVLVESGLLRQATHPGPARLHVLQVLAGPVCVGLSNFWIRAWLGAARRDRLMADVLRGSALALPLLGVAALALPHDQQLAAAAAVSLAGSALTCWLTFRAWIIGDRLALAMASGCLLTLPAIAGLYALAMHLGHLGVATQAAIAVCAALSNGLTGAVLWRRERHEWRTRETGSVPALDPVTKLHSGAALVHKMIASQKRRRRTRRQGALLAITVFDPERICVHVGTAGLNEVWMTLAARIQRQVGVVNPVGRYWDQCFVALVETIPSQASLRTLGLRLAASLRQPVEVTGRDGDPVQVRVDAGVGVVQLAPGHPEVEDVLDAAQRLAEAARTTASRTAMADPRTGAPVALETVPLPGRRQRAAAGPGRTPLPLPRSAH
jgi:GGDEF domain-containing protein